MTNNMKKIVGEYKSKMETILTIERIGLISFEKAIEDSREELDAFDSLRLQMYRYNLITENDFIETIGLASKIFFDYLDKF